MPRMLPPAIGRPSTRAFTRAARQLPGFTLFDWLHAMVYARWPYLYIGVGTGEHRLAGLVRAILRLFPARPGHTIADTYHGKVVPLETARRLVTVRQDVRVENPEQVIPFPVARDIVLQHPDHIVALDCPCRVSRPNPCRPLDVCLIVGEPFASFTAEHQPSRSRWITQDEAVEILLAEQARGHVAHAFFKDAMLGRFYAICNCCSCCCGAMQAQRAGVPMLISSGYEARVDGGVCSGCGACEDSCQFHAIRVADGVAVVDAPACMGCGVCVAHCPSGAVALVRAPARGAPLEIG